ncbi:TlpA family protein disulfide reductase [Nonlabens antarcticus]|uniref:TlpA family protein disulfide reductase n=1 Tax=Nonlabens antarcticus TaxID=392714 RepID=UPI001891C97B|nr:thioredoxin-like domain-containing protein [Nonlabens antarcticus]
MKNYVALVLIALVLFSCKNDEDFEIEFDADAKTIISGNVSNVDALGIDKLTVYTYDYLATDYQEFSADINADGSFKLEVPLTSPAELTVVGNAPFNILAIPGDSIHVTYTAVDVDSLRSKTNYKFTGDRSVVNERLVAYKAQFPLDVQPFYESEEETATADFLSYVSKSQKTLEDFNAKFIQDSDEPVLKNYIKAQEKYYLPTTLLDFANYRSYYDFEAPDADGEYYTFLDNVPELKTTDLVNTGTVQRLIYNLTYRLRSEARATAGAEMDDDAMDVKAIELAAAQKEKGLLYDYVIHDLAYGSFADHNLIVYEKSKELISKSITNAAIKKSVIDRYNDEKRLLDSPELPKEAELLTFKSDDPENYLDEIVANANGKVIYIDNWATWCGPCKVEFKNASPQLHEKFKDDVEFIYLCHNSERAAYIPSIAQFQIKGKHYFLEDKASSVIASQINLEGFPTYTIFNKEGEMVQSDYIHRPSYPETTEILTKLINE